MRKIIRLTENDLTRLVRRVIKESIPLDSDVFKKQRSIFGEFDAKLYDDYRKYLIGVQEYLNTTTNNPKFNWRSEKMSNALSEMYEFRIALKSDEFEIEEEKYNELIKWTEDIIDYMNEMINW